MVMTSLLVFLGYRDPTARSQRLSLHVNELPARNVPVWAIISRPSAVSQDSHGRIFDSGNFQDGSRFFRDLLSRDHSDSVCGDIAGKGRNDQSLISQFDLNWPDEVLWVGRTIFVSVKI